MTAPYDRGRQAKRLISLMWHLQQRRYTVKEIMEIHGVTAKTCFRDIRALEDMGVPIESEQCYWGDGGGSTPREYWIDKSWRPTRRWFES